MVFGLGGIIAVLVALFVFTLVLFFVSRILFRIMMLVTTIAFVVLIIMGILVLKDAYALSGELQNSENAFILQNNNLTVAGFLINMSSQKPMLLNSSQLANFVNKTPPVSIMNESIANTFYINLSAFTDYNFSVNFSGFEYLNKTDIITILESANATDTIAGFMASNDPQLKNIQMNYAKKLAAQQIQEQYNDSIELKSQVFLLLFGSAVSNVGTKFIFLEAKDKKLFIEPARITFTFINYLPDSIITASQEMKT